MSVPHSIPKKKRFANLLPVYPAFLKESLAKNFLQSFALPLARRQGMSRKNFAPRLQTFLAPLYQAAFVQRGCHPSSDQVGACVPETRRTVRPGFARRTKLSKEAGGRSPVMGVWGTRPMSTGASQVLIERDPQRVFGSFLAAQKGTRPAGRNSPDRIEERPWQKP